MGNQVNPIAFRLCRDKNWKSKWFSCDKNYFTQCIFEDEIVRRVVYAYSFGKPVAKVLTEKIGTSMNIFVHTDRVNAPVGNRGSYVEELRFKKAAISLSKDINISIVEYRRFTARYIMDLLCYILESTGNYRKVVRRLEYPLSHSNIGGFKIMLSGRLDESEKKRKLIAKNGKLPLQSISVGSLTCFTISIPPYEV